MSQCTDSDDTTLASCLIELFCCYAKYFSYGELHNQGIQGAFG